MLIFIYRYTRHQHKGCLCNGGKSFRVTLTLTVALLEGILWLVRLCTSWHTNSYSGAALRSLAAPRAPCADTGTPRRRTGQAMYRAYSISGDRFSVLELFTLNSELLSNWNTKQSSSGLASLDGSRQRVWIGVERVSRELEAWTLRPIGRQSVQGRKDGGLIEGRTGIWTMRGGYFLSNIYPWNGCLHKYYRFLLLCSESFINTRWIDWYVWINGARGK